MLISGRFSATGHAPAGSDIWAGGSFHSSLTQASFFWPIGGRALQKLTSNQNQSRPPGIVLHRPIRFSTAQYFSTFYPCLILYRDASLSSTRKKKEEGEDNDDN